MTRRIAMLYPGHSAEDDYPVLAERLGVDLPVTHTWEGPTLHDVESLRALGADDQLHPAAAAAGAADAVMWACTSGSFVYGWDGARAQADRLAVAAGVPASSTSLSFAAALARLAIDRVAVAATYPADVAAAFTDFLDGAGVAVTALTSHDIPSGEDAGRVGDAGVRELARSVDRAGADALLLPDTALRTARLIDELEDELGTTVLTANQVTAWQGMVLADVATPDAGPGRLFRG
ncbi:maleate cis-trans isomerase family protein [Naumannella huperziae]